MDTHTSPPKARHKDNADCWLVYISRPETPLGLLLQLLMSQILMRLRCA